MAIGPPGEPITVTEDEKRLQKSELLLAFQEAENELAHRREQLSRYQDRIRKMVEWLACFSASHRTLSPSELEQRHAAAINDPQLKELPGFAGAVEISENVRSAQARLAELKARKEELGLR